MTTSRGPIPAQFHAGEESYPTGGAYQHTEATRGTHHQPVQTFLATGGVQQNRGERHTAGSHASGRNQQSAYGAVEQQNPYAQSYAGGQHGGNYQNGHIASQQHHQYSGGEVHPQLGSNGDRHGDDLSVQHGHGYRVEQPALPYSSREDDKCEMRQSGPINTSSSQAPANDNTRQLASPPGTENDNDQERDDAFERDIPNDPPAFKPRTALLSHSINEADMIGEHPSYHQAITGKEAKRRLTQCGGHCYLTRYSKVNSCYILSVYECQLSPLDPVIEHYQIVIIPESGKLRIRNKNKIFDNIESLLQYYQQNRIDPALISIGEAYTEKKYKIIQQEEIQRQKQEQDERERQEQEHERKELERRQQVERERRDQEKLERREQEERERREQEERERRQQVERERRDQEKLERRERERRKCTIL